MEKGEDTHESSLAVNFARAQSKLQAINNTSLASSSEEYQKQARNLIELLRTCSSQVDSLSLFSSNETVEDYSTSELKLILVNAYLGEALQKLNSRDDRAAVLEDAISQYRLFLTTCQALSIIKQSEDIDRILSRKDKSASAKSNPVDAGTSRVQKIERFKRMRAMQQSIAELEAKLSGNDATEGDDDDMEEV
ncbi:Type 2A phosphatase-associated protein 42, partial [Coemansia sp. RSA 2603]